MTIVSVVVLMRASFLPEIYLSIYLSTAKEAAKRFERAAALHPAPAVTTELAGQAAWCRRQADAM